MRSVECGVRNEECGVWSVECGVIKETMMRSASILA